MRLYNPELTVSALRSALSIVNDELSNVKDAVIHSEEGMGECWMNELAELQIAKRVLERLHHEAHMDALEAAEYEEMRRDEEREEREILTYEEREEIRSYHKELEELDELLAGLKGLEF